MPLRLAVLVLFLVGTLAACGGSKSGTQDDAGPGDDAGVQDDAAGQDDAPDWGDSGVPTGYQFFFDMGTAVLLGQTVGFAVGGFWPAAREDFAPPREVEIPLGECVVSPAAVPAECATKDDCAPEQQCVADTNNQGQPIAGTEHCETPRTLMDVGPFTVDGFVSGSQQFAYNSGQSGAYTTANPGDGSIPADDINYDTTYTISGTGDPGKGIGAFGGEVHLPPALALTSPPVETVGMGFPGIKVSVSQALALTWSGNVAGGDITITLTGGAQNTGTSIVCHVEDTGSLTLTQEQVAAVNLGNMALTNMLEFRREVKGTASGDGLSNTRVTATQAITYNVAKQP